MNELLTQINEQSTQFINKTIAIKQQGGLKLVTSDQSEEELKNDSLDQVLSELENPKERILFYLEAIDEIFAEYENGFKRLGLRKKDVVLLFGMSGYGKTSVAMTMFSALYRTKQPAVFFSLDMDKERTWGEFRKSLVGFKATADEFLDELQINGNKPSIISKKGDISILQIDKFLANNPATTVFIDYIDYLIPLGNFPSEKIKNKNLMLQVKQLANKHNCAIILLSQGNEDKSYNRGRPTLMNIYGGKEIRSAADQIISVYRASKHNDKIEERFRYVTEINGAKIRGNSQFEKTFLKFQDGKLIDLGEMERRDYKMNSK